PAVLGRGPGPEYFFVRLGEAYFSVEPLSNEVRSFSRHPSPHTGGGGDTEVLPGDAGQTASVYYAASYRNAGRYGATTLAWPSLSVARRQLGRASTEYILARAVGGITAGGSLVASAR